MTIREELTALVGREYKVRGGAVFTLTGPFNCDAKTGHDMSTRADVVSHVEVTAWGVYALGDRLDKSARAEMRYYFGQGVETHYVKANAWNGDKWADMPRGGADAVAALVSADVARVVAGRWVELAREAWDAETAREANAKRSEAARAEAEAARIEARQYPGTRGQAMNR